MLVAAAEKFGLAYAEVEDRDAPMALYYKWREADSLRDLGNYRGDTDAMVKAVAAYQLALDYMPRDLNEVYWADLMNSLGVSLQALGITPTACLLDLRASGVGARGQYRGIGRRDIGDDEGEADHTEQHQPCQREAAQQVGEHQASIHIGWKSTSPVNQIGLNEKPFT